MQVRKKGNFEQEVQRPTLSEWAIAEKYRRDRARVTILRCFCAMSATVLLLWGLSPIVQFAIKGTDSVEGTLFFLVKGAEVKRGDIAAFKPPENGYYKKARWFGKYIAGVEGDTVSIRDRNFFINDQYIGTAKETSKTGANLKMSDPGTIPKDYFFMWTPHERSYDSRYADINWIHKSNIIGRLYRIF